MSYPPTAPRRPGSIRQHQAAPGPPGEGVRQPAGATKVDGYPKRKNIANEQTPLPHLLEAL